MEKGLNSDIQIGELCYHVQTEDWGFDNPYVVSRIFAEGRVVGTYKKSYFEIFSSEGPSSQGQALRLALKDQHLKILDLLISGKFPSK